MKKTMSGPPLEELSARRLKLQEKMQEKGIDGTLLVQNTDLYYFTGSAQQGWLFIPGEGEPLFMVFKDFQRAKRESALNHIVSLASSKKIPQILNDHGYSLPDKLGMELDVLPVNLYGQYVKIFEKAEIIDISTDIRLIRAVKSAFEIERIREAAKLSDIIAAKVPELLEVGKTEVAVAGELEGYARSLGHQGIVRMRMFGAELFYGHLLCGPTGGVASYLASPTGGEGVSGLIGQGAGFSTIRRNEPILVDYVFANDGYISDHTRIFVLGELDDELYRAHEVMLSIQEKVMETAVAGSVSGDLYEMMVQMAEKEGYADNFMGAGERRIRFTGHGVGLELDEFPFLAKGQKLKLEKGMIIALEPKVIFPGKGVVGIENTHLVTESGLEKLTLFNDGINYVN